MTHQKLVAFASHSFQIQTAILMQKTKSLFSVRMTNKWKKGKLKEIGGVKANFLKSAIMLDNLKNKKASLL